MFGRAFGLINLVGGDKSPDEFVVIFVWRKVSQGLQELALRIVVLLTIEGLAQAAREPIRRRP